MKNNLITKLVVSALSLSVLGFYVFSIPERDTPDSMEEALALSELPSGSVSGDVLGEKDENPIFFTVNVPSRFKKNISAPNIIYSITGGEGVTVTKGQSPTISNTGVLSLQGLAGELLLESGDGISINGLEVSNTLSFVGSGGTTISKIGDAITVSSSSPDYTLSGWARVGTSVGLTIVTDSVVVDTLTFGNATITNGKSIKPDTDLGSDLGSAAFRFNNLYVGNINSNSSTSTAGQATFTYEALSTALTEASVLINPTAPVADGQLLGLSVAGYQRALIDEDGDLTLGYNDAISAPASDYPLSVYGHNGTQIAFVDTAGNANFEGKVTVNSLASFNGYHIDTGLFGTRSGSFYFNHYDGITYSNIARNQIKWGTLQAGGAYPWEFKSGSVTQTGGYQAWFIDDNEVMRLDNDGDLGIGNTNPLYTLDVNGDINTTSVYRIGGDAILQTWGTDSVGAGKGMTVTGNFNTQLGTESGGQGSYQTNIGWRSGLYSGGTGNTAIGYYAGYNNDAGFSTSIGYLAGQTNSGANTISLGFSAGKSNTGNDVIAIGYQAGLSNTVANQFILQQTNINATPLIQGDFSTGHVGIGIATPEAALHTYEGYGFGDTSLREQILIQRFSGTYLGVGGGGSILFKNRNNNNSDFLESGEIGVINTQQADNDTQPAIVFHTGNAGALSESMRLTYDGKLGIGTTNPTSSLQIGDPGDTTASTLTLRGYYSNTSSPTSLTISPGGSNPMISGTGSNSIVFRHPSGAVIDTGTQGIAFFRNNGGIGVGDFSEYPNTNSIPTNGLIISGDVGIGTIVPNSKLNVVEHGTGFLTGLRLNTTTDNLSPVGTTTGITFGVVQNPDFVNTNYQKGALIYEALSGNGNGNFHFLQDPDQDGGNVLLTDAVFTITNAGEVGIGTTSPSQKLDVNGNIISSGGIIITTGGSLSSFYSGQIQSGVASIGAGGAVGYGSNETVLWSGSGMPLVLGTAGTEHLRISSSGNIGIGTETPSVPLEVNGDAQVEDLIVDNDAGGWGGTIKFYAGGIEQGYIQSTAVSNGSIAHFSNAGYKFYTDKGGAGYGETFTISESGNVGIGTNSPGYKLDVVMPNGGISGDFVRFYNNTGNAGVLITSRGDVYQNELSLLGGGTGWTIRRTASGATPARALQFISTGSGGTALSIDYDTGNVGIGADNPSQALEINGNLRFSTSLPTISAPNNLDINPGSASRILMTNGIQITTDANGVYPDTDNVRPFGLTSRRWSHIWIGTGNSSFAGNVSIGDSTPSYSLDVTGMMRATEGVITYTKAGTISDVDFTETPIDGLMGVDSTNGRLYFRHGGAWHYVAQTAGFQIPEYETYVYDFGSSSFNTSSPLADGDFLIPFVEGRMSDGAIHGLYTSFSDVKDQLFADELSRILSLEARVIALETGGLTTNPLLSSTGNIGSIATWTDTLWTFLGDVRFNGDISVSPDTAGTVTVPTGSTTISHSFSSALTKTPVIYLTPVDAIEGNYHLQQVSPTTFIVELSQPQLGNVSFNWLAVINN